MATPVVTTANNTGEQLQVNPLAHSTLTPGLRSHDDYTMIRVRSSPAPSVNQGSRPPSRINEEAGHFLHHVDNIQRYVEDMLFKMNDFACRIRAQFDHGGMTMEEIWHTHNAMAEGQRQIEAFTAFAKRSSAGSSGSPSRWSAYSNQAAENLVLRHDPVGQCKEEQHNYVAPPGLPLPITLQGMRPLAMRSPPPIGANAPLPHNMQGMMDSSMPARVPVNSQMPSVQEGATACIGHSMSMSTMTPRLSQQPPLQPRGQYQQHMNVDDGLHDFPPHLGE
ncbi:hypothetical protein NEOLEDRAFT_1181872 [Neolentinus lepideus HHB14362 ss-1]|uniref:Uncharacterized protein n=1 Tax=Neolentinus lepideus HHB14362 ss-1 TaxID=1314782 RepID=A0A165PMC3_9AGAM|nr:hypothetical protein NEOLEDRAFT_1181872 [Neolentinus lepideus HHB14362 ss-1]